MRNLLFTLPGDVTTDLWNEQLDSLQAVIRICLDLDMVLGAFEERLEPNEFNRDDLEILIMLAVTFSFVSYNRLRATYNVEEPVVSDDTALARRLRNSLQASMGWVRKPPAMAITWRPGSCRKPTRCWIRPTTSNSAHSQLNVS